MPENMTPSQFQILREDLAAFRSEINQRLDNVVSRESFRDEQRRVDGLIGGHGREIGELKTLLEKKIGEVTTALAQEAGARVSAQTDALNAQLLERQEREKVRRATMWQWLLLGVSIVVTPVVAIIIGSMLAQAGIAAGG